MNAEATMKASVLTPTERDDFLKHKGYLLIPDALSPDVVERARAAVDRLASGGTKPGQISINIADILGKDDAFLDLIDCPRVLPKIWGILGWNIWVQHSHLVVNPPVKTATGMRDPNEAFNYGWHRDGGAINRDVRLNAPLLIKVGYYLTDVAIDGGPTLMLDDADPNAAIPAPTELPSNVRPMVVKAGAAVLFSNRSIHSLKSPNRSDQTRRSVFIQYGYRWIQSLDRSSVSHLADRVSDVRKQLLGLTTTFTSEKYKGSEGRSGRFVPGHEDVPLFSFIKELLGPDAETYCGRSLSDSELRAPATSDSAGTDY
ncbi:MAG: phytanoyl-CoA dioxygenase family protein [Myxococcales bacterium]|nr:phytanoyl-CoA dioxygenase family protein [Myxococcales bacterium]